MFIRVEGGLYYVNTDHVISAHLKKGTKVGEDFFVLHTVNEGEFRISEEAWRFFIKTERKELLKLEDYDLREVP
jgi:hypothetical protein